MQSGINNKLLFFKVGYCYHPEVVVNTDASWKKAMFPAMVGLIKHESLGNVLFDTGYSERFNEATQSFPNRLYRMVTPVNIPQEEKLLSQLDSHQITADDIDVIFISHFHADHIAGLRDFPNAKFICSRDAYKDMCERKGFSAVVKGYLSELLPEDFSERVCFLEDFESYQAKGELDVFESIYQLSEDDSLLAINLPGHAKGHYGLLVQHQDQQTFLVGDACWTHHAYTQNSRPHKISEIIMDKAVDYHDTIDKLRALFKLNTDISIVPSHCMETLSEYIDV